MEQFRLESTHSRYSQAASVLGGAASRAPLPFRIKRLELLTAAGWAGAAGFAVIPACPALSARVGLGKGGCCRPAPAVAGRYRYMCHGGAEPGGGLSSGPVIFVAV